MKNSFLTPRIESLDYNNFYKNNKLIYKLFKRLLWFVPNNNQSLYWKNANNIGHGYEHFIKHDKDSLKLIEEIKKYSNNESRILDICCNVGRMLNELSLSGYKKLYGFDVSEDAIINSQKIFSNLTNAELKVEHAEDYLKSIDDNFFDVTFSLGASLELIPPHFDLVYHISRITRSYHICLINENGHAYPRFWKFEFNKFFDLIKYKKMNGRTLFVLKKNDKKNTIFR